MGARLADPSSRIAGRVTKAAITAADVERLEQTIDRLEAEVPPLRRFILPGGSGRWSAAPSGAHGVPSRRTAGHRAGPDAVEPIVVVYLNRLSDLLFVMARAVNHRAGTPEVEW